MKKVFLLMVAVFGIQSWAFADSFGVHFNFTQLSLGSIGLQYAFGNVFGEGNDLRFRVNVNAISGVFGVNLQVDSLWNAITIDQEGLFGAYYGGGLTLGYANASSGSSSATVVVVGGQATLGLSYLIVPSIQAFVELSGGYAVLVAVGRSGNTSVVLPLVGTILKAGLGVAFKF